MLIAAERFILVVLPFKAELILCKRNRIIAYVILTIITLGPIVSEISYRVIKIGMLTFMDCSMFPPIFSGIPIYRSFEHNLPGIVVMICFYCIPGAVSMALYVKVGYQLLRNPRNAGRNRVLTVALLNSCVFWVVSWGLAYLLRYYESFPLIGRFINELGACVFGWYPASVLHTPDLEIIHYSIMEYSAPVRLVAFTSPALQTFSSLMNAACLLVVCKMFWHPIITSYGLAKTSCNKSRRALKTFEKQSKYQRFWISHCSFRFSPPGRGVDPLSCRYLT